MSAKKTKKMTPKKAGAESDFITFQNHATIPTPLFFKTTKGSPSTPLSSKKVLLQNLQSYYFSKLLPHHLSLTSVYIWEFLVIFYLLFFPQKKCPTPKSESKKVTFGLNKNKTAGIRGQDSTLFGLYNYLVMTYISSVISDNLVSRSSFLCRSIVLMRLSYLFFCPFMIPRVQED